MKLFNHPQRIYHDEPSNQGEQEIGEFEHALEKSPATHFVLLKPDLQ